MQIFICIEISAKDCAFEKHNGSGLVSRSQTASSSPLYALMSSVGGRSKISSGLKHTTQAHMYCIASPTDIYNYVQCMHTEES